MVYTPSKRIILTGQLFTDIAIKMLESRAYGMTTLLLSRELRSLSCNIGTNEPNLPTWVSDWTCRVTRYEDYLCYLSKTLSPSHTPKMPPLVLNSTTLLLPQIIVFGRIIAISETGPDIPHHRSHRRSTKDRQQFARVLHQWYRFAGLRGSDSIEQHAKTRQYGRFKPKKKKKKKKKKQKNKKNVGLRTSEAAHATIGTSRPDGP